MNNLFTEDYIKKLTLLEKRVGNIVHYKILEPFNFDAQDYIAIQDAAKKISNFVGLSHYIFIVAKAKQKEKVGGHIELKHGAKEVFIEISDNNLGSSEVILATLAHEISHKFLHVHDITCGRGLAFEYENEILTDITAIFLGLGKLMLNGSKVEKYYSETEQKNYSEIRKTIKTGYLELMQLAFVYRFVCSMRKILNSNMLEGLNSRAKKAVADCDIYTDEYFCEEYHLESFRKKINEGLITDIRTLQYQLLQIQVQLDFLKDNYILNTEKYLEKKQSKIKSLLESQSSLFVLDNCYDPSLLFINTLQYKRNIDHLKKEITKEVSDSLNVIQNLNKITKLKSKVIPQENAFKSLFKKIKQQMIRKRK